MENMDVYTWLCEYLEDEFGIAEVREEDAFMNELALGSLDVFTLIGDMEYDFGIKISEKMIREMITVADMMRVVGNLLESK